MFSLNRRVAITIDVVYDGIMTLFGKGSEPNSSPSCRWSSGSISKTCIGTAPPQFSSIPERVNALRNRIGTREQRTVRGRHRDRRRRSEAGPAWGTSGSRSVLSERTPYHESRVGSSTTLKSSTKQTRRHVLKIRSNMFRLAYRALRPPLQSARRGNDRAVDVPVGFRTQKHHEVGNVFGRRDSLRWRPFRDRLANVVGPFHVLLG